MADCITILAEKPDVGKKIAAALDCITLNSGKTVDFASIGKYEKEIKAQQTKDGYLKIHYNGQPCFVTWGFGHLCTLKNVSDYNEEYKSWTTRPKPFIPENYEIQLKKGSDAAFSQRLRTQFVLIRKLFRQSKLLINATDFDREGEVIFSYIYELAQCTTPFKRACFSSQTKEGIIEGFDKALDGSKMKNVELAGRSRAIADWVVGINMSTSMTVQNPGNGVYSVGRVQTPTLALVVNRELAIKQFKSSKYYVLNAVFETPSGIEYKAKHETESFEKKAEAEAILKKIQGKPGTITDITKKNTRRNPPNLFSLSSLQMMTNSQFSLTANETLEIVQQLYDGGYTTYPRTNSQYLTEDMEPVVNKVLDQLCTVPDYKALIDGRPRKFEKKRYFDDKKVESHFAIIPTGSIPKTLGPKAQKVYDLICRSVITMLYDAAVIEQTKVITTVDGENFVTSGNKFVEYGWTAVMKHEKANELPPLTVGTTCKGTYDCAEKDTEPPKHYTDATLLTAMISAGKTLDDEELKKILSDPKTGGIGTEATRAAIIETLVQRQYIERNGKKLCATEKGIELIQKLPVEQLKSAEMTARWEKRLGEIERGNESADTFRADIENIVREWTKEIEATPVTVRSSGSDMKCPICGSALVKRSFGYGCAGYQNGCKFTIGTICGVKLRETQVKKLLTDGKTALIKGFTSKAGKKFDAYLVLEGGKISFEFPQK